jgi:predicted metal-dependent HD superfamily phosphohydrolase
MLKELFFSLGNKYTGNNEAAVTLWQEIEKNYTSRKRHYHNLMHLNDVLAELDNCKTHINNWDAVCFALFYHDIVYKAIKKDNEEQSGALAVERMKQLHCSNMIIEKVHELILATKAHNATADNDINLFTDADLSILGKAEDVYFNYCGQIRKEYSMYPEFLYRPGRKKVLQHFLAMEHIYKTGFFREKYETAARRNMEKELSRL